MAKYRGLAFPIQKGSDGYPKMVDNDELVWNDVKSLFNTRRRVRVMRPNLGMLLEGIVFDNTGPLLNAKAYREIATALASFEPRVTLESVGIADEDTTVTIETIISINGFKYKLTHAVSRDKV
jgi:phage baseplate assembly protein W